MNIMKTLLTIMVLTNAAKSPNIAVRSARFVSRRMKSRVLVHPARAGLIFCTPILLRYARSADPRSISLRCSTAFFMKGNRHGNFNANSTSDSLFADCGDFRPVYPAGVEKPVIGLPCPEFERIIDIAYKLTKWMKNVKIKIARNGKDKMDKGKPCEEKI